MNGGGGPGGRWRGAAALARTTSRQQRWGLVGLAVVIALGTAIAVASAVIADRTQTAYARYLDDAEVGDLVLNPSLLTEDIDSSIRDLPQARDVRVDHYLLATLDEGAPRVDFELQNELTLQVRGSTDGRFVEADRPSITDGRLPTGEGEAFLGDETAEAVGVGIGDELPLAFWWGGYANEASGELAEPLGVERVRVVGTGTLADEALPDELYPRQRVLLSPDVIADYDCVPPSPASDASLEEAFAAIFPADCALLYAYYSLDLEGGDASVAGTIDAFARRAEALSAGLPPALVEDDYSYFAIPTTTEEELIRVERSLQPTVTTARLLAAAALVATLVLTVLAVARMSRRHRAEIETFEVLGATRVARALGIGLPFAVTSLAAVIIGAAISVPLVAFGPLGVAQDIEPDPGPHLELGLTAGLIAATLVVLIVATVGLSYQVARSRVAPSGSSRIRRLMWLSAAPVGMTQGVAAALDRRRGADGPLAIAGAVAAIAAVTASLVFGASLSALLANPERYGWPADAAAVIGYGYGGMDPDAVVSSLEDQRDVAAWSALGSTSEVTVADTPTIATVDFGPDSLFDDAVLDGRLPTQADEIALGSRTAEELDLSVGSTTTIGGLFGDRDVTVTGLLATPAFGPYLADRAGLGVGAYLPRAVTGEGGGRPGQDASLVAVRLTDGVSAPGFVDNLAPEIGTWDSFNGEPFTYDTPVRPPEIVNVEGMRRGPALLAALLAATVTFGLSSALMLSVRSRREELAVLRVLGFTGAQVRRSVRWQAVTTVAIGLAVGLPAGVAIGRWAWQAFADDLGVGPVSVVPLPALAGVVVGAMTVALVVALLPGRSASRQPPGRVLREG